MVTIWLLLIFSAAMIAFVGVCAGAYFGLDRVSRARLEHEADEDPDGAGLTGLLEASRTLRSALDFLGDANRVAFCLAAVALDSLFILPEDRESLPRLLLLTLEIFAFVYFGAELTARTLAARNAEAVTRTLGRPLRGLIAVTWPLRALALRLLPRRIRSRRTHETSVEATSGIDEEEFRELVKESTEAGVVAAEEQALIHKILDFGDRRVRDVMTPFERIFSLPESDDVATVAPALAQRKYSRIPLTRGSPRKIVGVLYAKDLLAIHWGVVPSRPLASLMRRPLYVEPAMRAQVLLESFKRDRSHMAVVVDEQGDACGLCTMEDLLEELVGPITDVAAERKGDEAGP